MKPAWLRPIFVFALVFVLAAPAAPGAGQGNEQRRAAPAALAALDPGIAPGWLVQHADAQLNFSNSSQHSLRMDSTGYPRLVYGGDHLYYAYEDSGGWHTQTADAAWSAGSGAALALDSANKAHISYYDASAGDLKYATNRSGAWQVETVVSAGDVGLYSDIAIDSTGDPAIVYFNASASELHYIRFDSGYGGWGPDELVAGGVYDPLHPGWFSFALDTSTAINKPHVSFYQAASINNTKGALRYATYSAANTWVITWIDSCAAPDTCHAGEYNALALDPATKRPAVAYSFDLNPSPLIAYSAFNGASWSSREVIDEVLPGYISLGIDTTGAAHAAYQYNGLNFSRRTGVDTWTTRYVIDSAGEGVSLALFGTLARVAQYKGQAGQLIYYGHERTGWLAPVPIAAQGHRIGACSALAVDRLGRAHISYFDSANNRMLYARYDGILPWVKNTIDASGNALCASVIAVSPLTNNPAVGLAKGSDLYYAAYASGAWAAPGLVDSGVTLLGDGYQNYSLAVRSDGTPVFAYVKSGSLMYAYWNGLSWVKATAASPASAFVALALDGSDHPHILVYQSGFLEHAFNPGSGWQVEPLGGSAGQYYKAALAVGPSGQVGAAFMSNTAVQLYYASRTCNSAPQQCAWTPAALADAQCDEMFSLALDRSGTPHLACTGWTGSSWELHYSTRSGSAWAVQAVDTNRSVGWVPGLALSPSGRPRISYFDQYNGDLKFAQALDSMYLPAVER